MSDTRIKGNVCPARIMNRMTYPGDPLGGLPHEPESDLRFRFSIADDVVVARMDRSGYAECKYCGCLYAEYRGKRELHDSH